MKKLRLIFSSVVAVLFLMACGGGSSTVDNKYLGEYPSMVKNYKNSMEQKKKELKECTDMQKAFKLSKEHDLQEEEGEAKIKEYIESHTIKNAELPFEAKENPNFTITKVLVNKVYAKSIILQFKLKIKQDIKNNYGGIEKRIFLYYKAVDKDGNTIAKTKTVATNFKRIELKAGIDYEVFGTWNSNGIANLEYFAKVVQISKQEYKEK